MGRSKAEKQAATRRRVESLRQNQWKYDFLEGLIRFASVPLLVPTTRRASLEPLASGVLIKIDGRVFIFTASHVLEDLKGQPIFIPVRNGLIVEVEGTGRGNRAIDAGVFTVENKDLEPFLDIALPAGIVFAQSDVLEDRLILYGYPAREYKRNGKVIDCPPRQYQMTGKPASAYCRLERSPASHILMNWPNKVIGPRGIVGSPSLAGMSGCGVWFVPHITARPLSIHAPQPHPCLVGVFIEQRKNEAMLIATNVSHYVQIVWAACPDILEKYRETYRTRIAEMHTLETILELTGRK
jgi:hypothetical protein